MALVDVAALQHSVEHNTHTTGTKQNVCHKVTSYKKYK